MKQKQLDTSYSRCRKDKHSSNKMLNKGQIIRRLEATLKRLKATHYTKFDYTQWVSSDEVTKDKTCGTVCCVGGWYPQWFPRSGFYWKRNKTEGKLDLMHNTYRDKIKDALSNRHGLNNQMIECLFLGEEFRIEDEDCFLIYSVCAENGLFSSKGQVVKLWETVLKDIKSGKIQRKHYVC